MPIVAATPTHLNSATWLGPLSFINCKKIKININQVLPASGCSHGNNYRHFSEWKEINCILKWLESLRLVQNLMRIKIVKYKILVQVWGKSILKDFIALHPGPSLRIQKWSGWRSHRMPMAREGGEHERGDYSPSRQGGLGVLLRENFWIFGTSMCVFKGVYAFETRFQSFLPRSFARKDISCHTRNRMLDKLVFRQSWFFFNFFYSTFLWHYFIYVPAGFGKYF